MKAKEQKTKRRRRRRKRQYDFLRLVHPKAGSANCGAITVFSLDGTASNEVVRRGRALGEQHRNRGARNPETGVCHGSGYIAELQRGILAAQLQEQRDVTVPDERDMALMTVTFPRGEGLDESVADYQREIDAIVRKSDLSTLGWIETPVNDELLSPAQLAGRPAIWDLVLSRNGIPAEELEVRLYTLRRKVEMRLEELQEELDHQSHDVAVWSCSSLWQIRKGLIAPEILFDYFLEGLDPRFKTRMIGVHVRMVTLSDFSKWSFAHPFPDGSFGNGEDLLWSRRRAEMFKTRKMLLAQGHDPALLPAMEPMGPDSMDLDRCLGARRANGWSHERAVRFSMTPAYRHDPHRSYPVKRMFDYAALIGVSVEGPQCLHAWGFSEHSNGPVVVVANDRLGQRPARKWKTTFDDDSGRAGFGHICSEMDVSVHFDHEVVADSDALGAGACFVVHAATGAVERTKQVEERLAAEYPYRDWLSDCVEVAPGAGNFGSVDDDEVPQPPEGERCLTTTAAQEARDWSLDFVKHLLVPTLAKKSEPAGSMGTKTPQAILTFRQEVEKPPRLYWQQRYNQVNAPPKNLSLTRDAIDPRIAVGFQPHLFHHGPIPGKVMVFDSTVTTPRQMQWLLRRREIQVLDVSFPTGDPDDRESREGLVTAIDALFDEADNAIERGKLVFVVRNTEVTDKRQRVPIELAATALYYHLVRSGQGYATVVAYTDDFMEPHLLSVLEANGVSLVYPPATYRAASEIAGKKGAEGVEPAKAGEIYRRALLGGDLKIRSKVGVCTSAGYRGSGLHNTHGLREGAHDRVALACRTYGLSGLELRHFGEMALRAHRRALDDPKKLRTWGLFRPVRGGLPHIDNRETVRALQAGLPAEAAAQQTSLTKRVATGNHAELERLVRERAPFSPRDLLEPKWLDPKDWIPLDEVEPVESLIRRFGIADMSDGANHGLLHRHFSIAGAQIGGQGSGEGAVEPNRYWTIEMPQFAQAGPARWGCTAGFFAAVPIGPSPLLEVHRDLVQLSWVEDRQTLVQGVIRKKHGQDAKGGDGGAMGASKNTPRISRTRGTRTWVSCMSSNEHGDMLSVEAVRALTDLFRLNNPWVGQGDKTKGSVGSDAIAVGLAYGGTSEKIIATPFGGTGNALLWSAQEGTAGPTEVAVVQTDDRLIEELIRPDIRLVYDGAVKSGYDILIGLLLGADKCEAGKAFMIAAWCQMLAACHEGMGRCAPGIATQNPALVAHYAGTPEGMVAYAVSCIQELRIYFSRLGIRTGEEAVGRRDKLQRKDLPDYPGAAKLDISMFLRNPDPDRRQRKQRGYNSIVPLPQSRVDDQVPQQIGDVAAGEEKPVVVEEQLSILDVGVGARTAGEIERALRGTRTLAPDTVRILTTGSAGHSYGSLTIPGMTLRHQGFVGDTPASMLSGGDVAVGLPKHLRGKSDLCVVAGHYAGFAASSGTARFGGRVINNAGNSNHGATLSFAAVGRDWCQFMTTGNVLILSQPGRNGCAGLSGGTVWVVDERRDLQQCVDSNTKLKLTPVTSPEEQTRLQAWVEDHVAHTKCGRGHHILDNWSMYKGMFIRVESAVEPTPPREWVEYEAKHGTPA